MNCSYVTFEVATSSIRAIAVSLTLTTTLTLILSLILMLIQEMNGALFGGVKIEVSSEVEIPADANTVEMWRKKQGPNRPPPGGNGEAGTVEARPQKSWGDDMGPPAEGQDILVANGASRGIAQYDDDDEVPDF